MNSAMRVTGRKASDPRIQVDPLLAPGQSERFKRQVEFYLRSTRSAHPAPDHSAEPVAPRTRSSTWHIALSAIDFSGICERRPHRPQPGDADAPDPRPGRDRRRHLLLRRTGRLDQAEREQQAAERIFGLLPADQAADFHGLWDEFEARRTPESRFAHAMDRFQAFLHNYFTDGLVWRQHGIRKGQVVDRMQPVDDGASVLWEYVRTLMDDAVGKGFLAP
jgi:putative hydrolase of HD superfamily